MRSLVRPVRRAYAVAAFATGVLVAGAAQAQLSSTGGPIATGADHASVSEPERVQIWSGRAEAIQGDTRIRADEIRIYHLASSDGGFGAIDRFVATGSVYFVTPTQVIRGDSATYTPATDVIVVTGGVIVRQGENVLTGSRLTIQVRGGRAVMEGESTEEGRRVRAVLYPEE